MGTNSDLTKGETFVCQDILQWNLHQDNIFEKVLVLCQKWDLFVDKRLQYLTEKGFDVKFWSPNNSIFTTMMQFIDLICIDFRHMEYSDDIIL